MSATVEWDSIPFELTSPEGTLVLNDLDAATGGRFLINRKKSSMAPEALRITATDLPQHDGADLHQSFKSGYLVRLALTLWKDPGGGSSDPSLPATEPACGVLLRQMWDRLMLLTNSLFRPAQADLDTGNCRLLWTPSGAADRMVDRIKLTEWPTPSWDDIEDVVTAAFGFRSPLPYAMSLTQQTDELNTTVTNPGTAEYWPVLKVHGPASTFTIINETTGEQIGYDAGLPGASGIDGGDYAEIACFNDTIYLNGDGANLKAGVDIDNSEFFALAPGANVLTYAGDGGTCEVLWNPAWS